MRSSSELFKQGIMKGYTEQPNVSLNSDTIKDMAKYQKALESEDIDNKNNSENKESQKKSKKKIEADEATGASSAGAFSGPLFTKEETTEEKLKGGLADSKNIKDLARKHSKSSVGFHLMVQHLKKQLQKGLEVEKEHTKDDAKAKEIAMDHLSEDPDYYTKLTKIEANETTSSGSVGSYETPAFLAKNSKNWRGGKKPLYKGGKFVQVKKKCQTFPYCNQGDIKSVKIFENETLKKVITNVSQKTGVDEQIIRRILYNNFRKRKNK